MSQPDARSPQRWRAVVFKNRGLLLVPVALVLVIFGQPTPQSAAWGIAIAALGEALRIWAVGYSGVTTRADVVTAPQLVTAGPYSYLRNPLYLGNAVTAFGFWLAFAGGASPLPAIVMLFAVVLLTAGVYATIIPLEEAYLLETFGAPYREYLSRVPRIIPTARPLPATERAGDWRLGVIFQAEVITGLYFALMAGAVLAKLYWARGSHI